MKSCTFYSCIWEDKMMLKKNLSGEKKKGKRRTLIRRKQEKKKNRASELEGMKKVERWCMQKQGRKQREWGEESEKQGRTQLAPLTRGCVAALCFSTTSHSYSSCFAPFFALPLFSFFLACRVLFFHWDC